MALGNKRDRPKQHSRLALRQVPPSPAKIPGLIQAQPPPRCDTGKQQPRTGMEKGRVAAASTP